MDLADRLRARIRNVPDFPKAGIQFKDITPILSDHTLLDEVVDALAGPFRDQGITKVIGIEARGFILGPMLAYRLGAGFIPVRKEGKLPHETMREVYALEYGEETIEMHSDALAPGDRVLIHDDVLATGGTAGAAYRLAHRAQGETVGYAFLLELTFLEGRHALQTEGLTVHSVLPF